MLLLPLITLTAYYMQIKKKNTSIFHKIPTATDFLLLWETALVLKCVITFNGSKLFLALLFFLFNTVLVDYFCLKDHVDIKPAKNYSTAATAKKKVAAATYWLHIADLLR